MGRHSNGHRNLRVTKEMVISIVAAVLVLMVGAWWILNRMNANSEHNQAGSCPAGDLTLVVAAQDNPQVQSLLDSYKKSNPVVKDRCVKTEVVGEVANAALALIPGTKETVNARLQIAGRSASTNNYPVALRTSLGIAELKEGGDSHEHSHDEHEHEHSHEHEHGHDENSWAHLASHGVIVPGKDATFFSAVAATALAGGDPDRAANMLRENSGISLSDAVNEKKQRIATTEPETPEGYTYEAPEDIHVNTLAVPLTSSGTVSEDESRAAAHFARYVADNVEQTEPNHTESLLYSTAQVVSEHVAAQPTLSPEDNRAKDTLLLLDTSEAMSETMGDQSVFSQTVQLLDPHIRQVAENGGRTALWNYSSPRSSGVSKGWRSNVPFSDQSKGENVVSAMQQFGLGGEPWTRSSVLAALATAAENARVTGKPTHIILVTSGTADRISVHDLWNDLEKFHDADVHVHVIHVGDDPVDESLASWSKEHFGSAAVAKTPQELSRELDRAFQDSFAGQQSPTSEHTDSSEGESSTAATTTTTTADR